MKPPEWGGTGRLYILGPASERSKDTPKIRKLRRVVRQALLRAAKDDT